MVSEAPANIPSPAITTTEVVVSKPSPDKQGSDSSNQNDIRKQGDANSKATKKKDTSEKNGPKELKVNVLPPVKDIITAIPPEGISTEDLAAKWSGKIDATNAALFAKIVQRICNVELKIWVKLRAEVPSEEEIEEMIKEAKKPPPPKEILESNQTIGSKLIGPISITFRETDELVRGASNRLPSSLYRTFYENSATLSSYVSKHTHVRHRQEPHLKLRSGVAFQSIEDFDPNRDLTKVRIERHLVWNQKKDPSSYISTFSNRDSALRRAHFHYDTSNRIGHRVAIAEISTNDLVAVTIRGTLSECIKTTWREKEFPYMSRSQDTNEKEREVQIPAWISKPARPAKDSENTNSISVEQFSNLRVPAAQGHDFEWLATGQIPKTRITRVMPFDGFEIYEERKEGRTITSRSSEEPWVFNWASRMWVLSHSLWKPEIAARKKRYHDKRNPKKRNVETNDDADRSNKIKRLRRAFDERDRDHDEAYVGLKFNSEERVEAQTSCSSCKRWRPASLSTISSLDLAGF
ncbi:hypothetical protein P280DRAFT_522442 [Massarina eburnea CBS 473.64]|uniref:DUF7587 domain-containing protein n=1 Tax=Massarina eburnea CBS 473.64 TaxID=1395130 RepID=A0A6A6RPS9_9PLEO|nr:hypothetical protein P280DRAFT_522442 [Massarina eburnea CBS 473.64]